MAVTQKEIEDTEAFLQQPNEDMETDTANQAAISETERFAEQTKKSNEDYWKKLDETIQSTIARVIEGKPAAEYFNQELQKESDPVEGQELFKEYEVDENGDINME